MAYKQVSKLYAEEQKQTSFNIRNEVFGYLINKTKNIKASIS